MNALQPRIMQGAVGIHPIVVLGSVLIGSKIAGIPGAIFGIPVAAVVSSFFFHFLHRIGGRPVGGGPGGQAAERARRPTGARSRASRHRARPSTSPSHDRRHAAARRRPADDPAPGRRLHAARDEGRPRRGPGHDPRAGADRAARPRQGARRAAGRWCRARRAARPADAEPAGARVDEQAAHPGHQRRRRRVARPAGAEAGTRADGRGHGRRARTRTRAPSATRRR